MSNSVNPLVRGRQYTDRFVEEGPLAVCDFTTILPTGLVLLPAGSGHTVQVLDDMGNDVTTAACDPTTLAPDATGMMLTVDTLPGLAAGLYRMYFIGMVDTATPTTQEAVQYLRVSVRP